jgi:hypothetical protein
MRKCLVLRAALATLLCATVMPAAPSQAQVLDGVPHLISYQGRLTDTGGDPVTDGEYVVTFTIWSDSTSTAPTDREWISPNCTVLVVNGLFNWQLGSREGLPPWTITNDADLWLGIKVGSDPEITPRTRLCSAPYAYKAWQADYAEYADSAGVALSGGLVAHAEIVNTSTDANGDAVVTYPVGLFSSMPSLAVTAQFNTGGLALMGHVTISGHTQTGFTVNVKDGSGTNWNGVVQISYTAIEQ